VVGGERASIAHP
jgi:hypothetical protein